MRRILAAAFVLLQLGSAIAQQPAPDPTVRELRSVMDERDKGYEQRFAAQEKAVAAALAAAKEAVDKAGFATEKRFDSVNEFRGQLKDQTATLMPRTEVLSLVKSLEDKIKALDEKVQSNEARIAAVISRAEGANWLWGFILAAGGLITGGLGAFATLRRRA